MCLISCIYMTDMTSITSFFLFHLILVAFKLLSIFVVMINMIEMEPVNTVESCLRNIFSARYFFYQLNYSLSIPFPFDQD